jgi:diguanylate cyclase (GGDEF)-like protein
MKRRRHEAEILERLAGIDGVPRLSRALAPAGAIALEDESAVSLADVVRVGRLEIPALLDLSIELTRIVAAMHRAGVLHMDITPANIMLAGAQRKALLIDFDLATTFAEQLPSFAHDREIAGTLAYIPPEQTGRTGHNVDQRADLYSLGITLYELATGQLPFDSSDPLQMLHDHLARIPRAPAELDARVPRTFSEIILRLIEKEPDRRYQSAEGLLHDLRIARERLANGDRARFELGEHDFPMRLSSPSRLVGRDAEIEALRGAFENAMTGQQRGVLIVGDPGVGKTALINELRPIVSASGAWFVSAKFDQYRPDATSGALLAALRSLGHLLLAEPEAELKSQRSALLRALDSNAGLIAELLPEFALLLGPVAASTATDPVEGAVRLRMAMLASLRTIASPARPIVMVLDDLQWANESSIRFIESILTDENMRGFLFVGAYRGSEVDVTHPLSAMLKRWESLGAAPLLLRLQDLVPTDLARLLGEMLRLAPSEAATLSAVIGARTGGNPYDTVELLNALRHDGALLLDENGWNWNEATIRRYIGEGEVVDLLAARISKLPRKTQELLEMMACLGSTIEFNLLEGASGLSAAMLRGRLMPALEDGLLLIEGGGDGSSFERAAAVQFRHDRVQQAAYDRIEAARRGTLHLATARRLAKQPQFQPEAAEQYLAVAGSVREPEERRRVTGLFRDASIRARRTAYYPIAERFLKAAIALYEPSSSDPQDKALTELETARHAVLYSLARYEEADAIYGGLRSRCTDPLDVTEATCGQIASLCNRGLLRDALTLGLGILAQLGMQPPSGGEAEAVLAQRLDGLYAWIARADVAQESCKPEIDDPSMLAAAKIVGKLLTPAFYCDPDMLAWLALESQRLWTEFGPCAALLKGLSSIATVTIKYRDDYRTGYNVQRHCLAVGEARGYEPETSFVRYILSRSGAPWFEPLEECIPQSQRAREGLLRGGDLQIACSTYFGSLPAYQDCSPTLEACTADAEAAIAFAEQTGNNQVGLTFLPYRQLLRALRGETNEPGRFTDASFDETAYFTKLGSNPTPTAGYHIALAISAVIFGDQERLIEHTDAFTPLLPYIVGNYRYALAQFLRCLALADRARAAEGVACAAILADLDTSRNWLAKRSEEAPGNFGHLLRLVEAERAWACGDSWNAALLFDEAVREAEARNRPWHLALITERAGLFNLAHGLERAGQKLLVEARHHYDTWGASAKVEQLDKLHSFLYATTNRSAQQGARGSSSGLSSGSIDLMGILGASQALSSETTLERLRSRVVELLGAMTGATGVSIALWQDEEQAFFLLPAASDSDPTPIPIEAAAERGLVPLSAFRFAQRSGEPLLVDDASGDDRFARDPYFAGLDHCSLLVVPVLSQGTLRAILFLENRLTRSAFSTERLDAVKLIVGQLAVSIDNALLYASLEKKVTDRTEALAETNRRLEVLSLTDPLTALANRRRFAEVLDAEWARARRTQRSIGIAMIDIDHFKLYNDHYGHLAGDACLCRVATAISDSVRQATDLVARYGGEEFSVILPEANRAAVLSMAERARAAVVALNEPHERSGRGIVTVSIGVAAIVPTAAERSQELIGHADAALYEAKRKGRNQVMSDLAS